MKKLLKFSSFLATAAGILMLIGGAWGIYFTYQNVTQEKIVTPSDASIPNTPVKGPFTLKAQAEIIRKHTLRITEGKTFAEMPGTIPQLDESGNPVLNEQGKPIMVPNTARDIWITATTLRTALSLALVAYALSALAFFLGLMSIGIGIVFYALSKKG